MVDCEHYLGFLNSDTNSREQSEPKGLRFLDAGVIMVSVDYRNFPQVPLLYEVVVC